MTPRQLRDSANRPWDGCEHTDVRVGEVETDENGFLTGRVGLECCGCGKVWSPEEAAKLPAVDYGPFTIVRQ